MLRVIRGGRPGHVPGIFLLFFSDIEHIVIISLKKEFMNEIERSSPVYYHPLPLIISFPVSFGFKPVRLLQKKKHSIRD